MLRQGPIVNSVRTLELVNAGGDVLELTRSRDAEVFAAVFGGYGGLGVVTEVELELASNARIERIVSALPVEQYLRYTFGRGFFPTRGSRPRTIITFRLPIVYLQTIPSQTLGHY